MRSSTTFRWRLRWRKGELTLRLRHHVPAFLAGAVLFAVEQILVGLRYRIGAIVAHNRRYFVQERVALRTEPLEAIDLAVAALAFENEREGFRPKARRVRYAGRRVDHRAFGHQGDLFLAVGRAIVQLH